MARNVSRSADSVDDESSATSAIATTLTTDLKALQVLGFDADKFADFAVTLRDEMAPRSAIEQVELDMALLGLIMLRQAAGALQALPFGDMAISRTLTQGHKLYNQAMKGLRKRPEPAEEDSDDPGPATIPLVRREDGPEPIDPLPDWRSRIEFPEGPPGRPKPWPIVRGTDLLVEHLMSLIDDGWPSDYVLRTYPQLKPDDLRACKGCDLEGLAGPPPA